MQTLNNPESGYVLQASDVGKPYIRAFGRVWLTSGFIGRILAKDVGKYVYRRGDSLQVESDDQLDFRLHGLRGQGGHATHVTGCPGCGKAINPIPAPGTYSCSGCGATVRVNPTNPGAAARRTEWWIQPRRTGTALGPYPTKADAVAAEKQYDLTPSLYWITARRIRSR